MKKKSRSSAQGASTVVVAAIGLALTACGSDFSRGAGGGSEPTDGGAPDGTTVSQDPVPGVPGGPEDDGGSAITDAGTDATSGEGGAAACTPAATAACTADEQGREIPGIPNPAKGICALGVKTCSSSGTWGPCKGAVGPKARDCESAADNDCDGKPDSTIDGVCECNAANPSRTITGGAKNCQCAEACGTDHKWIVCTPPASCDCAPAETRACTGASGCAGGTQTCAQDRTWGACAGAPNKATYCLDHDGDTFCSASISCSTVCPGALAAEWKTSCATTDCDDNNASINPNAKPACKPTNECHTGALSCSATGNMCADTGTALANRTACTGGVCNAGICAACVTGDARCSSNTPQTCNGAGQWANGTACAPVATCASTGTSAKCACPAGYSGDGTGCVAVPVIVCYAAAPILSDLALVGSQVAFSTDNYPVDGGTNNDVDVCPVTASNVPATVIDVLSQARLGGAARVGSHAGAGKLYASTSQYVSQVQSNVSFTQYSAPAYQPATVPLTVVHDLSFGSSSFDGIFAVDTVSGYVFMETSSGLQVTTIPEPLPTRKIAPSMCYSTTDVLQRVAAGGTRAAVFNLTATTIMGVTAPACSPAVTIATNVSEVDALATDGNRVFFNDRTNTYACPFSGCGGLSSAVLVANQGVVTSIALDDTNAYWVGPSGLVSCAKAGCPNGPKVLTSTAMAPASVAVDATSVYFSKGNAVYRIAKQ